MRKKKIAGSEKTSGEYLKSPCVEEAKKIVEESKDLPHLQKVKYLLKN